MNKPIFQKLVESFRWIIGGILVLPFLIGQFTSVGNYITFKFSIYFTFFLLLVYLITLRLIKYKKVKWKSVDGSEITITKIGIQYHLYLLGVILFLWIAPIWNNGNKTQVETVEALKPAFDSTDKRFKILILPFLKECEFQGTSYDIGQVISKRLEMLNTDDSLNLTTIYLNDSTSLSNFTLSKADSLKKYHNADQILYGYYSLKGCEVNSDKICFNYITSRDKWDLGLKQSKTDYKMTDFTGLESLRKGEGQEDIDYVIYYIAALSSFSESNYIRVINLLKKINNYRYDENIGVLLGFSYLSIGDLENVKRSSNDILVNNPNSTVALNNIGSVLLNEKNYKDAIVYFKKAIQISPDNESIWNNLGLALYFVKDYKNALIAYQKGLIVNPNSSKLLYNIGQLYYYKGEFSFAKQFFLKSLDGTKTKFKDAKEAAYFKNSSLFFLGQSLERLKDSVSAKQYYDRILESGTTDVFFLDKIGEYYLKNHEWNSARKCFEEAVKLEPKNDRFYQFLGDCLAFLNDPTSAKKFYEQAVALNFKNNLSWNSLGYIHVKNGDFRSAKQCFENALSSDPKEYSTLYNLAHLHSNLRNEAKTINYLKQAIASNQLLKNAAKSDPTYKWLWDNISFREIVK